MNRLPILYTLLALSTSGLVAMESQELAPGSSTPVPVPTAITQATSLQDETDILLNDARKTLARLQQKYGIKESTSGQTRALLSKNDSARKQMIAQLEQLESSNNSPALPSASPTHSSVQTAIHEAATLQAETDTLLSNASEHLARLQQKYGINASTSNQARTRLTKNDIARKQMIAQLQQKYGTPSSESTTGN